MSKIGDKYRVHDSIESARQFEMKETGRTHWSREEPPPLKVQPILIKVILLIAAFLLPVVLTLLSFKFVYRAFIIAVVLFLSVETSGQPTQKARIGGVGVLLFSGSLLGGAYLTKHKFSPCQKRGIFRLRNYYGLKNFNPVKK